MENRATAKEASAKGLLSQPAHPQAAGPKTAPFQSFSVSDPNWQLWGRERTVSWQFGYSAKQTLG